jgi:ribosomal protein L14E/L6E/L27E
MLVEQGRVCVKRYGRDAGSRAIITKVIDKNFVQVITTDRRKERRCNTRHLEFLNETVSISDKDAITKILGAEEKPKRESAPKKKP